MPGPTNCRRAINAVHADAVTFADTDWPQIVALYDHLLALDPSPVVALNRAIAVAEVDGPEAGLAVIDTLDGVDRYHAYHAARGELLARTGNLDQAARPSCTRRRWRPPTPPDSTHADAQTDSRSRPDGPRMPEPVSSRTAHLVDQ